MKQEKKFSELGFFSKHFNVPLENLTWGIKQEIKNNESYFTPCLLIKNTNLCIEILEGELKSELNFPNFERHLHEASFIEEETIILETITKPHNGETVIVEFSEEDLEIIYQNRWYDESLNDKLLL